MGPPTKTDPPASAAIAHEPSAAQRPIAVAVASESYLVRTGLHALICKMNSVRVGATFRDGDELLAAVDHSVDVVVTDLALPPTGDREGLRIAQALAQRLPRIGVVVISEQDCTAAALALFAAGDSGRAYLVNERLRSGPELETAIRAVAAGESWFDPTTASEIVRQQRAALPSPLATLTPRELEVLAAIAEGKSNAAIADQLVLTKRAVEKHVGAVFSKLGLSSETSVSRRVSAALLYLGQHDR